MSISNANMTKIVSPVAIPEKGKLQKRNGNDTKGKVQKVTK